MKTTFYTTLVPVTQQGSYNKAATITGGRAQGCTQNRPTGDSAAMGVPIEVTIEYDVSIFDPIKIDVKITKSDMVIASQIEDLVELDHELQKKRS